MKFKLFNEQENREKKYFDLRRMVNQSEISLIECTREGTPIKEILRLHEGINQIILLSEGIDIETENSSPVSIRYNLK